MQLAACGSGSSPQPNPPAPQVVSWPIAKRCTPRPSSRSCPVALSPSAPQIAPGDVALYEPYGYSAWTLGGPLPHIVRERACPRLYGRAQCGAAVVLLLHHRHSYRRQGIPGPADLYRLERAVRSRARAGSRRPIRRSCSRRPRSSMPPSRRSMRCTRHALRFRHVAGRCLQQHPVQRAAMVYRCHRRQGHHAQLRRACRGRHHRLSEAVPGRRARPGDPLVSGHRQPRSVLDGLGL